jgi:hypothetical protein
MHSCLFTFIAYLAKYGVFLGMSLLVTSESTGPLEPEVTLITFEGFGMSEMLMLAPPVDAQPALVPA